MEKELILVLPNLRDAMVWSTLPSLVAVGVGLVGTLSQVAICLEHIFKLFSIHM